MPRRAPARGTSLRVNATISTGDKLPDVKLNYFDGEGNMQEISVGELTKGKKVRFRSTRCCGSGGNSPSGELRSHPRNTSSRSRGTSRPLVPSPRRPSFLPFRGRSPRRAL